MTANDCGQTSPVVTDVVEPGWCSGCGVCAAVCPGNCLRMVWNPDGLRIPQQVHKCPTQCGLCMAVCPFGNHGVTEDDIAADLFGGLPAQRTPIGSYIEAYVGHASAGTYRADGSSGGLSRWFLASLLERDYVDRVICVVPGPDADNLFTFADLGSPEDVRAASKSAYYPVDLASVLQNAADKRYAIIGLPCVIKGVRLAARRFPALADKVAVLAGLVCGQLKSRAFTSYLLRHLGIAPDQVQSVSFREKDPEGRANDFNFYAAAENGSGSLPWTSTAYGGTHGRGEFKLRACDVCDDVFAETADIAFMDAWLSDYREDPAGTSIAITRSGIAEDIIRKGIERGELDLQPISIAEVLRSQTACINSKIHMLPRRLWMMEAAGEKHPPKRAQPVKPGWYQRLLLGVSARVRATSHQAMREQHEVSSSGLEHYHKRMRGLLRHLRILRVLTRMRDLVGRLPAGVRRRVARSLRRRRRVSV